MYNVVGESGKSQGAFTFTMIVTVCEVTVEVLLESREVVAVLG